jgi:hypothetical protein
MTFMEIMQHFFMGLWTLLHTNLHFPDPIGDLTPIRIAMFFGVAFLLADVVNLIASRRD